MTMRATILAMSCGALAFGCSAEPQPGSAEERQEIIDNLVEAGFPVHDVMVLDGEVYVGRDAHISLQASRELLETGGSSAEHYRTTNIVSGMTRICINPTAGFTSYTMLDQGLTLAIINYNALPLVFDFVRGPATGCSASITAATAAGTGGTAGYPSGGYPYPYIYIGTGLQSSSLDTVEHVITHELGHTIGIRHTDFYDRSISCGTGGNEGTAGVGAILVPGTPSTATYGGSIFNACVPPDTDGELTSWDISMLNYMY